MNYSELKGDKEGRGEKKTEEREKSNHSADLHATKKNFLDTAKTAFLK